MGDIPSPSSFKSALSFFSSLDRSGTSPLIPRKKASNFEVNLKLVIDSKTVANTSYDVQQTSYDVKQFIPRAKLMRKQDEFDRNILRNIPDQDYQRPVSSPKSTSPSDEMTKLLPRVPPKVPPKRVPRPTPLKLKYAADLVHKTLHKTSHQSNEETQLLDPYQDPKDQLTPDLEAKQIFDAFKKEITPYNTFEIPVNALDSDFFKQTMTLVDTDASVSDMEIRRKSGDTRRNISSSYRLPEKKER